MTLHADTAKMVYATMPKSAKRRERARPYALFAMRIGAFMFTRYVHARQP